MLRLRENLLLKVISLAASVLLWVYVQNERPPIISRSLYARVVTQRIPSTLEIKNIPTQTLVSVSGPMPNVERLKDGDIQAVLDFHSVQPDKAGSISLRPAIVLPDTARGVVYDPPTNIKMQVSPQQQLQLAIQPSYSKEAPAGFRYGSATVSPRTATVSGHADALAKVDRLIVLAEPPEAGANIDGDFPVLVRDSDNNPVDDVTVLPDKVHVNVPLIDEPVGKYVIISPSFPDQPLPPYVLKDIAIKPNQVEIMGRPERLNQVLTLQTEDISLRDLTADKTFEANLIVPPDITVRDKITGKKIKTVSVHVTIRKNGATTAAPPDTTGGETDNPRP